MTLFYCVLISAQAIYAQDKHWKSLYLTERTSIDTQKVIIQKAAPPQRLNLSPQYFSTHYLYGRELENTGLIKKMIQDKEGNIWFIQEGDGLFRFDGKHFLSWQQIEEKVGNNIRDIIFDQEWNLWISSRSGLFKYDGRMVVPFDSIAGMTMKSPHNFFLDTKGVLWILGSEKGDGVAKYENGQFLQFNDERMRESEFMSAFEDAKGRLWFFGLSWMASLNGEEFSFIENQLVDELGNFRMVASCDDGEGKLYFLQLNDQSQLVSFDGEKLTKMAIHLDTNYKFEATASIVRMTIDSEGKVWMGNQNHGLFCYSGDSTFAIRDINKTLHQSINDLLIDNEGRLWISTAKGITLMDPQSAVHYEIFQEGFIFKGLEWKDQVWFPSDKFGLVTYKDGAFYHYGKSEGLLSDYIADFRVNAQDELIIYSDVGYTSFDGNQFTHYDTSAGWYENVVYVIMVNKRGDVLSYEDGGLVIFDGLNQDYYDQKKLLGEYHDHYQHSIGMANLYVDSKDNVWVGTYQGELLKLQADGEVAFYGNELGLPTGVPRQFIEDWKGDLLVGYEDKQGLYRYDGERFQSVKLEGLKANYNVNELYMDHDSILWLLTDSKVLKIQPKDSSKSLEQLQVEQFGYDDGFHTGLFVTSDIFHDAEGHIWLMGNEYVVILDEDQLKEDSLLPEPKITALMVNREKVDWNQQNDKRWKYHGVSRWDHLPIDLNLNYKQNRLSFEFIGLGTPRIDHLIYRWKLEGFDEDWSPPSLDTKVEYSDLPPGTYTFQLLVSNPNDHWKARPATFSFTIVPPFWATWWFRLSALILVLASGYSAYKYRVGRIKERSRQLKAEVDRQTKKISDQKVVLEHQKDQLKSQNEQLQATIIELNATRDQLVESEKLAVLGQLVASVAHELNTPLGAIKASMLTISDIIEEMFVDLLNVFAVLNQSELELFIQWVKVGMREQPFYSTREERSLRKALKAELATYDIANLETVIELLSEVQLFHNLSQYEKLLVHPENRIIIRGVRHLTMLSRSSQTINLAIEKSTKVVFALKSYSHNDDVGKVLEVDLKENIETILTIYGNQLKQGIEVISELESVKVMAYPDELSQIWTNIIHNAIQAMRGRGQLELTVKKQEELAEVKISDNGPGIPEDIKDRIFDPFFTTKPQGEGSGLGLNIVQKIVHRHKGQIWLESRPGKTTFTIHLPLLQ